MEETPKKVTLREFLLHHTNVGEYVVIFDGFWRIGMTWIDNEDLFLRSLNPDLLDMEVQRSEKVKMPEGFEAIGVEL